MYTDSIGPLARNWNSAWGWVSYWTQVLSIFFFNVSSYMFRQNTYIRVGPFFENAFHLRSYQIQDYWASLLAQIRLCSCALKKQPSRPNFPTLAYVAADAEPRLFLKLWKSWAWHSQKSVSHECPLLREVYGFRVTIVVFVGRRLIILSNIFSTAPKSQSKHTSPWNCLGLK